MTTTLTTSLPGHADFGKRLTISLIDERATSEPEREWLSIPRSADPADGWEPITYEQAARAINRVAQHLLAVLGLAPTGQFPTVAYIGPNDSRYLILMYGAVKAGYKALFVSPRNSTEGQIRLFKATECVAIIYSSEFTSIAQPWLEQYDVRSFELAPERQWYAKNPPCVHVPYDKTFEEAKLEPLVVLHTSGSSGFPKPIVVKHGTLAVADGLRNLPMKNGCLPWIPEMAARSKRILNPMPLFHAGGLYVSVWFSSYYDSVSLGIASKPMTADIIRESLMYSGAESIILPPSVLEDMCEKQVYIEALKSLKIVSFGGGNLTPQCGKVLVDNHVALCNLISSTEAASYVFYFQPKPELWPYFILDAELGGIEWRAEPGHDNVHKHVFRRKKDRSLQGIFYTFPDVDEYDTHDLYQPHPTLKDHWKYYGRADTIIVLSNGEKLNPVDIEAAVTAHPRIKGAIVVGTNRFEPALLLEPVADLLEYNDGSQTHELIDSVWPLVHQANLRGVAHGHVSRDLIMVTTPGKPLPRAGKGTIQRSLAVQLYGAEIDSLYECVERGQNSDSAPYVDVSSEEALAESIRRVFMENLEAPDINLDTDYFTVGVDSLQVITAARLLSSSLRAIGTNLGGTGTSLMPRDVYSNSTHRRLAAYIFNRIPTEGESVTHHAEGEQTIQQMTAMVDKYSQPPFGRVSGKPGSRTRGQVVLLTGSTGALGSHLLHELILNNNVERIICLNRGNDGYARQSRVFSERDVVADLSKCDFLSADLSLPNLGLADETYHRVCNSVDRVIHNAWPVNFNLPLTAFEPHVRGVRHLVDFCLSAPRRVSMLFISSIGSVDAWPDAGAGRPVPEEALPDLGYARTGYGQSKHVSDLILDRLKTATGCAAASIRVGQIAGPKRTDSRAVWNRHEWLPSIIASSLHLGVLPHDLGSLNTVDWVPIEDVAGIVLDIVAGEDIGGVYHCVNPRVTQWPDIAPHILDFYGSRLNGTVSFVEWVAALRKSNATERNPGVKLLDMYEKVAASDSALQPRFEMRRTMQASTTARELEPINGEMIKRWCGSWDF